MPRSGIAGSYGDPIFSFQGTVLHGGCTNVHLQDGSGGWVFRSLGWSVKTRAGAWKLGQERRARKRNTPSWFPSTKFFESSNDAYGRGTVFILNTQGWKPLFRKLHKNAAGEWRSQHTHPRCVTPQSDGGHVSLPQRSPARSQSSGSSPGREKRPAGKERGVRAPVCLPDPGFGAEI